MTESHAKDSARRCVRRRPPFIDPMPRSAALGPYTAEHLRRKRAGRECNRWLSCVQRHLEEAVRFFERRTLLAALDLGRIEAYAAHLLELPNGRGAVLTPDTVNHYLNSLSNLFRRSEAYGLVRLNPVKLLLHRPPHCHGALVFLETDEVARVLQWAQRWRSPRLDRAVPLLFELLAVFAYRGGRAITRKFGSGGHPSQEADLAGKRPWIP